MESSKTSTFSRITNWFALSHNVSVIALTGALAVAVNALWTPFIPLFMAVKGVNTLDIALAFSFMLLGGIFSPVLGGYVSNYLGRRKTILIGNFFYSLSVPFFFLSFMEWQYWLVLFFFAFFRGFSSPPASTLVMESVTEEQRGTALAQLRIIPSLPAIITAPLGGLLFTQGNILLISIITTVGLFVMTTLRYISLRETVTPAIRKVKENFGEKRSFVERIRNISFSFVLLVLIISYSADAFSTEMVTWFIPIYVTGYLGYTAFNVGLMTAAMSGVIAVLSLVSGKLTDHIGNRSTIILSWILLSITVIAFASVQQFILIIILYSIWTAVDLLDFAAPTVWIANVSTDKNRASNIGLFSTLRSFASLFGPVIGLQLVLINPTLPFYFKGIIILLALIPIILLRENRINSKNKS